VVVIHHQEELAVLQDRQLHLVEVVAVTIRVAVVAVLLVQVVEHQVQFQVVLADRDF
jgi:hypothetical protein